MPDSSASNERRALQIVVAIASLVPILGGAAGIILGPLLVDERSAHTADLDSHFRYLSGILLGIGLAYASAVPGIDRRKSRFMLLCGIVVLGGLGRLFSLIATGTPSPVMIGALVMELLVTPLITLWQLRIAR
jgi:hypothetical protein